jgi:sugar phosphate isomerase/epimerase
MKAVPSIGIGHLTMLDVAPPDLVSVAHQAGFDAVGIRAAAVGPTEEPYPMGLGSPMLAETLRRMDDTGIRVLDVELIRLNPQTVPVQLRGLFETGAELGARFVNVMADDTDLDRSRDNFAALVELAGPYGLQPVIEAIPYMQLKSLADAVALIGKSGGGLLADPLHLHRAGGTPADLRALDPELISYYQLCDAPRDIPTGLPRPQELPRGQSVENITDIALESRAARLLPGDGDLPLADFVAAMPPRVPVNIEAPNLALLEKLGPVEFARRARAAMTRVLGRADPQYTGAGDPGSDGA